jgi:hypothetical protein
MRLHQVERPMNRDCWPNAATVLPAGPEYRWKADAQAWECTRMHTSALLPSPLLCACALLGACAGQIAPAETPVAPSETGARTETPATAPSADSAKAEPAFPDQCAGDNAPGICSPPAEFVQEICSGRAKPDVALVLFGKATSWTHGYVRRNVEAWYTGSRSSKSALKSHEEVVVLRHGKPAGGIIINGGGAPFDVIRLDGACATLGSDELTLKRPDAPKHAIVPWRQLDPRVRQSLETEDPVAQAISAYDDGCRDSSSPACAKANTKLTAAIVGVLARGGKVPALVTWR